MHERWTPGASRRRPGLIVGLVGFALGMGPIARVTLRGCDPEGRVLRRRAAIDAQPVPAEGAA